jgi:hypothetical protein
MKQTDKITPKQKQYYTDMKKIANEDEEEEGK